MSSARNVRRRTARKGASCALAAACATLSSAAHADLGDQVFLLRASDGQGGGSNPFETGDRFGASVAIDSGILLIGAPQYDINRFTRPGATGAAYLFDLESGQELRKLTPSDGAESDSFGEAVELRGDLALIGAPLHDDGGRSDSNRGAAYFFDASTGEELTKIVPPSQTFGDRFGSSVEIEGDLAAIVAAMDRELGLAAGAVYLYDLSDPSEPILRSKIVAPDGGQGHNFGGGIVDSSAHGVAIDGDRMIVGASGDSERASRAGAAYIYDISDPASPIFVEKITADDAEANDGFGRVVDIDGGIAIAGARSDSDAGQSSGSAYLFDAATGQQLHKLTASDASAQDRFGQSVAIDNGTAVIGASFYQDSYGAAYIFEADSGDELAKITPSDARWGKQFGWSVTIENGNAIVGADEAFFFGLDLVAGPGSAYVFDAGSSSDCPADLTGPGGDGVPDGTLTSDDFFFYLGLFAAGDPQADLTGPGGGGEPDGSLTSDDFFFYLGLFAQGCP